MIINNDKKDYRAFYKEFNRKLAHFLNNAPIIVDIAFDRDILKIKDYYSDYDKEFIIDTSIEVKDLIFSIKQDLVKNIYPIITGIKINKVDYTEKELSDIMDENPKVSIEKLILDKKIIKNEVSFRIERLILKNGKNEMFIKSISSGKMYRYKLKVSCFIFIKNLLSGKYNRYEAFKIFKKKAIRITKEETK